MIYKSFYLVLFLLLSFSVISQPPTPQEMIDIRADAEGFFRGSSIVEDTDPEYAIIVSLLNEQSSSGHWPDDVVYNDIDPNDDEDNDGISWDPIEHLENLKLLSEFYAHSGVITSPNYTNSTIGQRIILGLQYWYWYGTQNTENCNGIANCATTTPCATNWWWNTIGKLREIQEIAILVYDLLEPAVGSAPTVPGTSTTLLDAITADFPDQMQGVMDCNGTDDYTGANQTEVAVNLIIHGLLTNDGALAELGANELKSAVSVGDAEGIQFDNSFLQHKELLYTGGYGHEFIEKHCLWAELLLNTIIEYGP